MSRPVPMWAAAGVALVALLVGGIIGLEWRQPPVERLAYCSLTGSHETGTPPCPPDVGQLVWAAWAPGVRTPATWDGQAWHLSTPVLGIRTTTIRGCPGNTHGSRRGIPTPTYTDPPTSWGPM